MNISPRRRRRMMREHQLRQDGRTLEQIAETLGVSIATVHDDLRLLEEHWKLLTQDIHDDLLLRQIVRLDQRVERLSRLDPIADAQRALGPEAQLSYDQLSQIADRHERRIAQAERELRMLLKQLRNRDVYGSTRAGDYPDHELADSELDRKNLKEPETAQAAIPSETLEIATPDTPEKSSSQTLKPAFLQHSSSPPQGEMSRSDRGGHSLNPRFTRGPAPSDPELPPGREAEALRLTNQYEDANARGDALAQFKALDKLVALYNP